MTSPASGISSFSEPAPKPAKTFFYHPELDMMRFGAFLMVFVAHTVMNENTGQRQQAMRAWGLSQHFVDFTYTLGRVGSYGVDVFFCLSAYLIIEILLRECRRSGTVNVGNFYRRRILRIWPLYFTFLFFTWWVAPLFLEGEHFYNIDKLGFLFFAGNWVFALGNAHSAALVLWSVSIEEQFYLTCPWVLKKFPDKLGVICVGLLLMATVYRVILVMRGASTNVFWASTFSRIDAIALGALVAVILKGRVPDQSWLRRAALITLSGVAIAAASWFGYTRGPQALWTYPAVAAGCAGLLLGILSPNITPPAGVIGRVLVHLGRVSYGLYVFHLFAIWLCEQRIHVGSQLRDWLVTTVAAFLLTVLMALISYRWLEMPFLRLKDRFSFVQSAPRVSV